MHLLKKYRLMSACAIVQADMSRYFLLFLLLLFFFSYIQVNGKGPFYRIIKSVIRQNRSKIM